MANNFIPWLGSNATASPQQANYGKIALTGFEAGGFVKAEDFNAALRMTTLVCAGIASVFGFDNKTIDASEDAITKAIQAANVTLGNITATGVLKGNSLTINGTERIDSTGNIKNIASIDTVGSIRAGGVLEGNSLTINGSERINSDGNITGTLVTVNKASMTHLGFTAGSNLVIDNDSNISANKIISDTSITAKSININGEEMIDSSRNIKNVGTINTAGSIITSSKINGTNITASGLLKGNSLIVTGTPNIDNNGNIDVNSVKVNGSTRIDNAGNITGATVTSNGKLSGTYLNIGPLNGNVAANVDINGNITTEGSISSKSDLHAKNSIIVGGSSITMGIERINNAGIMFPACLNLLHIKNCAQNASGKAVTFSSTEAADGMEFGCNLPTSISSNNRSYIFLVFMGIRVAGSGSWESFHSDYSGLLTANDTDGRQATIIFNIYSGNGASVGSNWGTARISYQPYSLSASTGCYLSYEGPSGFNGTINIEVKMYPIAIFG